MRYRLLFCAVLALGLASGCATTDPSQRTTREINNEHVSSVERVAKRSGVRVVWINPPTRVKERQIEYSTEITVDR